MTAWYPAVVAGGTEVLGLGVLGILLDILQLGVLGLRMLVTLELGLVCVLGQYSWWVL